jgi:hypothetical protein
LIAPSTVAATVSLRWATAAVCVALAVSVACVPLTSPATAAGAVGPAAGVGLAGVVLLLAGLAGWSPGIGGSVALMGTGYGISLVGHGGVFDRGALFVAPAILLIAELGYWSLDARVVGAGDGWARRAALVAAEAVAALIAAGAVGAAVALPAARGFGLSAMGVAAAVGVLAIASRMGRPAVEDPAPPR